MILSLVNKSKSLPMEKIIALHTLPFKKERRKFIKEKALLKKYEGYIWGIPKQSDLLGSTTIKYGQATIQLRDPDRYSNLTTYYLVAFHEIAHLVSEQMKLRITHTYEEEEICAEYVAYLLGKKFKLKNHCSHLYLKYWYNRYIYNITTSISAIEKQAKIIAKEILK